MKLSKSRQLLGSKGELFACAYLQKKGYRILDRNFKARYGELDIVTLDGDTLVFVEVKTRIGRVFGLPEEAVTPRKLREVIKTSQYYISVHQGLPANLRIDVIGIEVDESGKIVYFNHIPNVTL